MSESLIPNKTKRSALMECKGCPYYGPRVGAKGDPNSPILIIGESPGRHEVEQGWPFVGPSGKLLDSVTKKYGVEPYYINALQCFPGYKLTKEEDTVRQATHNCRHHVLAEIAKAPRKVILALGAPALWSITNSYDYKITFERGKVFQTEFASVGLIPSVHPAFLLRGGAGASFQQFRRDVDYAFGLATGTRGLLRPPHIRYTVAQSAADVYAFASIVQDVEVVAADVETSGFSPVDDYMLCAGFAWHPNHVFVVPQELLQHCDAIFESPARFAWHNGKFDIKFFWRMGVTNARVDDDTMLMSYALDEIGGIHDLETVSNDWLNSPNWKNMLEQHLPKKRASYKFIPTPVLHEYMAYDVGNTRALVDILRPQVMRDSHLRKLYLETLTPASNFLATVENTGLHVDVARVEENDKAYLEVINEKRAEIIEFAKQFPDSGYTDKLPGSPKQMKQLLYDDLKIPLYKNQRTTDKKVLAKLPDHPFLRILFRYRKVAKERGTYIVPYTTKRHSDGKLHTTYGLHSTRTGRLNSSEPNVQNVPRNPQIRGQIIPPPGRRFVEVDLNQAELRTLAVLSGDKELCRIYLTEGMSLHDEVRAEIWGYPKDYSEAQLDYSLRKFGLTPNTRFDEHGKDLLIAEQKMRAKNVNFGVVYGITAVGLAEQTDDTAYEAQKWIDAWFKRFPDAGNFLQACKNAPLNGQVLVTTFGRKKRFGVVSNELLQGIQNEAANFPMQSPASDCTLHAGIRIDPHLRREYDAYVVNLIHDALLIECPDDDDTALHVAQDTIAMMEQVPKDWGLTKVPFVAEAKEGYRWGSLTEMNKRLKAAA